MAHTKWDLYEDLNYNEIYFEGDAYDEVTQEEFMLDAAELDASDLDHFSSMQDLEDMGSSF